MGPRKAARKRKRVNATWQAVRIETTPGLYRLIGPLRTQKGKQKTLCIAIGGKRLKSVVDALNEMGIEI
jgi:hypothetical protein